MAIVPTWKPFVNPQLLLHQRRKADFRRGVRLGKDDVLTVWMRPAQWLLSCGLSRAAFAELPEVLPVRLVRITHTVRGFRNRTLVVATTLLDPVETPADEIRALVSLADEWGCRCIMSGSFVTIRLLGGFDSGF